MGGVEYYIETLSGMLMERASFLSLCVPAELAQPFAEQRDKGLPASGIPLVQACEVFACGCCASLCNLCGSGFRSW